MPVTGTLLRSELARHAYYPPPTRLYAPQATELCLLLFGFAASSLIIFCD